MKHWLLGVALICLCSTAKASPYFNYLGEKNQPIYVSQGALFTTNNFSYQQAFTNVAVVYHPLSAGSIIPAELQAYLPPESWSINLGAGYASTNGSLAIGPGLSINLLDSVRAHATNLLNLSSNATVKAIAAQIAPGNGPLNITIGPQWEMQVTNYGTVLPFNQMRLVPRWFVGASFGF